MMPWVFRLLVLVPMVGGLWPVLYDALGIAIARSCLSALSVVLYGWWPVTH